jgi:hypothetical protein
MVVGQGRGVVWRKVTTIRDAICLLNRKDSHGLVKFCLIAAADEILKYDVINFFHRIQSCLFIASTTYFKKGISPLHPVSIPVFPLQGFSKVTFVVAKKHL